MNELRLKSLQTAMGPLSGLYADPDYLHSFASAALDSRDAEGYSRRGSLFGATRLNCSPRALRAYTSADAIISAHSPSIPAFNVNPSLPIIQGGPQPMKLKNAPLVMPRVLR